MTPKGLSHEICEKAWQITLATIAVAAEDKVTSKLEGAIVVADNATAFTKQSDWIFIGHVNPKNPVSH